MVTRDSPDERRARVMPWAWRLGPVGGLLLSLAGDRWLPHRLSVHLTGRQQAHALFLVGWVYAARLPIHLRLKYLAPPSRSSRPRAQRKLNQCFGLNVAFASSWICGTYLIAATRPTEPAIFILCTALYYLVIYGGDWTSEAAQAAGRRLGSDAVREWPPIARIVARDKRASGRNAPLAGVVSFLFAPSREAASGISIASRFVLGCALALYLGILISVAPTYRLAKTYVERTAFGASGPHISQPQQSRHIHVKLPGPPPTKVPDSTDTTVSESGDYASHCTINPGTGGGPAARAQIHTAVLGTLGRDGIGGNETGCLTKTIKEPNHPGVWLALGYCGTDLRGLVAIGPGWPAEAIIQQPAEIAAAFAANDELLGISQRYDVGTGDMVVIATTLGTFLLIRPTLSNGHSSQGARWCDAFSDENVAYTKVPPGLVPLMLELEAVRRQSHADFLWPANDTSEHPAGRDFTFHTSTGESSLARANCTSNQKCTLWYQGMRWNSGANSRVTLASILSAMPPPPPPSPPARVTTPTTPATPSPTNTQPTTPTPSVSPGA